jgi:hypothetical protein
MGVMGDVAQIDDSLVQELGRKQDQCCDEMEGFIRCPPGSKGCDLCPVKGKCQRLWSEIENVFPHTLKLKGFRQYSQKFHQIKEERNCILARRGIKLAQPAES